MSGTHGLLRATCQVPLCMYPYTRLFHSCRVPGDLVDEIISFEPAATAMDKQPCHVRFILYTLQKPAATAMDKHPCHILLDLLPSPPRLPTRTHTVV